MTPEQLEEMRPLIHQHMCMLTAANIKPARALRLAALVAIMSYDGAYLTDALSSAEKELDEMRRRVEAEAATG